MKLKLIKTLWGIDEPISVELFKSIKEEGYHGIEFNRLAWCDDREKLVHALNVSRLAFVCQIHTSGGYMDDSGEYVYCGSSDVQDHKENFTMQLKESVELIRLVQNGGFVNVHAGLDAWSDDEIIDFLTHCFKDIEKYCVEDNITVAFETHRQRLFGSPFQTRHLLSIPTLAESKYLKFNADLSHWYCACERVFDPNGEDRDKIWWPKVLSSVSERCEYIHARFGFSQGPQMADPSAPECQHERQLQIDVWKVLIKEQQKRNNENIFMSPEFGPAPYLPLIPHTLEPVSPLPAAVSYTKRLLEELFESNELK